MNIFFSWYYSEELKKFLSVWKNFLEFIWNYFSIGRFFRTLFSPWKKDVSRIYKKGLHPILFLQTFLENFLTRVIGALLKLIIIFLGLFFESIILIFFSLFFLLFIFSPLIILFSFISIFLFIFGFIFEGIVFMIFFIFSFFVLLFSFFSFRTNKKNYFSMPLLELAKEKWFERVLNKLGLDKNSIDPAIFTNQETFLEFLRSIDITKNEFREVLNWEILNQLEKNNKKKFWLRKNLLSISPIGRYWSYAYTNNLDKYSIDLCAKNNYQPIQLIGRENEFNKLMQLLLRPIQNKVLLIGDPGTGRDTLIQALAKEIQLSHIKGPLKNKRLLELNIKDLLAKNQNGISDEKFLERLFSEAAYAGNIILVLKDLHEYLDPLKNDISSIISQFLSLPTFQIISTTNPTEFHSKIEKKPSIMKYFEKITLQEMNEKETLGVMIHKIKNLEKNRVVFTFQSLRKIIKLADRYVKNAPFPEKALDIMEEVLFYWKNSRDSNFITTDTVDKTLSIKFNIPLGKIRDNESEKLIHLEKYLHQQVVGQKFAIRQIAETMRRARIGMTQKNKPLGSFLFLGPTGVGKTESAKALARSYFGDENRMIRLDMSEYQMQDSISRLIGSQQTGVEGYLINKVKDSPFSLLLLDEIEKAYPDILSLFLQILDEGFITDAFGKKINFSNLIIIATSNAGSETIKEAIQNQLPPKEIQKQLINYITKQNIFRPEFLNRFESIVFFHPLTKEETFQITKLLLEKYAQKLKKQHNIKIVFEDGLAEIVAQKSYEPQFGARAINRYIKDKIENKVVKKIISKRLQKGTDFILKISDLAL